jgi:molecular chaperone GrpE
MEDKNKLNKNQNKNQNKNKKEDKGLTEKVDELEAQLKHALADYHNLTKRIEQRQQNWRDRVAARLIDKILDVYDDLDRAKKELKDKGLTMAVDQLWSTLTSEGVEKINPQGDEFDADRMDCVKMVDGAKNEVVDVTQTGYLLNNQVIRPAKVTVGKGKKKEEKENG